MERSQHVGLAYGLSLAGALLVVVGTLVMGLLMLWFAGGWWMGHRWGSFDGPEGLPLFPAGLAVFLVVPLVAGLAALYGAASYGRDGTDPQRNGLFVLIGGAVGLLGMGGMFFGSVLAVAGGGLMLATPREPVSS